MYFYVSWYMGDPYYPVHDNDCSLLISISSVSRSWALSSFPSLPKRLMIDSGGFRFAIAPDEALTPRQVLARQLELVRDIEVPTIICARDYPLFDETQTVAERDKAITQTIAFAYEFKNLIEQKGLPDNVIPLAIVQGYNVDTLSYCANELKTIGFPMYGIGSLAKLKLHDPIVERISAIIARIGAENLHIFGVSGIKTLRTLSKLGIHSTDSTRPARAAAFNEVFYNRPFRTYGISPEKTGTEMPGRISRKRRLSQPLPCTCPVCRRDASQILQVGKREGIRKRTLHNYFHLKQVVEDANI